MPKELQTRGPHVVLIYFYKRHGRIPLHYWSKVYPVYDAREPSPGRVPHTGA